MLFLHNRIGFKAKLGLLAVGTWDRSSLALIKPRVTQRGGAGFRAGAMRVYRFRLHIWPSGEGAAASPSAIRGDV